MTCYLFWWISLVSYIFQPKIILILENQTGTDLGNDLRYLCTMTSFLSQVFLLYVWYYFKVVGEDRAGGTENNILEHWFHMVPQVWPHLWTLSFHMCAQWAKKVEWVSCNVVCINLNLYWVKWSYQSFIFKIHIVHIITHCYMGFIQITRKQ